MAMLAEPRQRKRYHINPKGKALYEDESRFGTKMLERMGWKKGEGLGASSEGSKDFIRIRYKNDVYGFGYEQRDDQWTQHEQCFNGLLKALNNEDTVENINKEEEISSRVGFGFQNPFAKKEPEKESVKLKEKISGVSLEERSKRSKARVHYKKFTKGKDLAQYSEKDLANIFGKKAVAEQQVDDFYTNLSMNFGVVSEEVDSNQTNHTVDGLNADRENNATKKRDKKTNHDDKKIEKNDLQEEEKNITLQTFTSSLSVQDYFKMKMDAIRNKKAGLNNGEKDFDNINNSSNDERRADLKKKKKTKVEIEDDCEQDPAVNKSDEMEKNPDDSEKEVKVIEKKKRKAKKPREVILKETNFEAEDLVDDGIRVSDKKSSKKTKINPEQQHFCDNENQDLGKCNTEEHFEIKSKRKRNTTDQTSLSEHKVEKDSPIVRKTKKNKVRDNDEPAKFKQEEAIINVENLVLEPATKKLKKGKHTYDKEKLFDNEETEDVENVVIDKETGIEYKAETNLPETKPKKEKYRNTFGDTFSKEHKITKKIKLEESNIVIDGNVGLIDDETNLLQETAEKKKSRNKKKLKEVIEIMESDDEPSNGENQPILKEKKIKSEDSEEPAEETAANEDTSILSKQFDKNAKTDICEKDIDLQVMSLEELKTNYQAFNIYKISSFCAEKFRNVSFNDFKGSSLHHIGGYGLSPDFQLDIQVNSKDEERITNLWKNALNKYEQTGKPKKTYKNYIRESIVAMKTKHKAPKLNVKTLKRKNAFQLV